MLRTLILTIATFLQSTSGQNNVGCDSTCPPVGYESDSSHFCTGMTVDNAIASKTYDVCHPTDDDGSLSSSNQVSLSDYRQPNHVTVIANYYTGCEAGRRESGVFAAMAQRIHDETGGRVHFVTSLKGGGDCSMWASIYQNDASNLNGGILPTTMPLTINDVSFDIRDDFFTPPYPHPSYIILDQNLQATFKSVGPCCGYASYFDCTTDIALGLDGMLTEQIMEVYNRQKEEWLSSSMTSGPTKMPTASPIPSPTEPVPVAPDDNVSDANTPPKPDTDSNAMCKTTTYSDWSACSQTCGTGGIRFRFRTHSIEPVQTEPCPSYESLPPCEEQCVPEFGGSQSTLEVIASQLDSPRDLAFHPTPGIHLGSYSEGRTFYPDEGEELWVVNGNNHSVSIIASLGTPHQTTLSRRDRGYYHYMINATALAFNTVSNSNRRPTQDTFNYFAVCNDNRNDYLGAKEPNFFMGPTLYDTDNTDPSTRNVVNRMGDPCHPSEPCYLLHADMLHESPSCLGIAHDPELQTAYGAVYWVFDSTGADPNQDGGQLVQFDFSQPHGPGSMDHSIASVRRYPEVTLLRGGHDHTHAGMVIHPNQRILYVSNPGKGSIEAIHIDTGKYSRTAREEYPIFSNRLPSFEYSIYECVDKCTFIDELEEPSGMALSHDMERLIVAERGGTLLTYEIETGSLLQSMDVSQYGYTSIGGLTVSPQSGEVYFVDMDKNEVVRINAVMGNDCNYDSRVNDNFQLDVNYAKQKVESECGKGTFSLMRDYSCEVDGTIPSGTLFEQVHTDGYASNDPNVQSMAGMDATAALLANRTDCGPTSDLNFDALLLGGYYCHTCLPRNHGASCDEGGQCDNVQWRGFTCDNEYFVDVIEFSNNAMGDQNVMLMISSLYFNLTYPMNTVLELHRGISYRFTVRSVDKPVYLRLSPNLDDLTSSSSSSLRMGEFSQGVTSGPIILSVDENTPAQLYLMSPSADPVMLLIKDNMENEISEDDQNDNAEDKNGSPNTSEENDITLDDNFVFDDVELKPKITGNSSIRNDLAGSLGLIFALVMCVVQL